MKIRLLLIASFFALSSSAFAQLQQLTRTLAEQVDNAIAQGNTAQLAQLAAANPLVAVTIARRVAGHAQTTMASDPAAAASLAAVASTILTQPSVTTAAASDSSVAGAIGSIAMVASSVAANQSVKAAAATNPAVQAATRTIVSNVTTVATNPAVVRANPLAVRGITSNLARTVILSGQSNVNMFSPDDSVSGPGGSE